MDARREKGRLLARDRRIRHVAGTSWLVPSQDGGGRSGYLVDTAGGTCTCEDYELHRAKCKHQWAVELAERPANDGGAPVTRPVDEPAEASVTPLRKTYAQDWPAYNAAQCAERAEASELLRALCECIVTPPHPGRGPKPIPLADVVFAIVTKTASTVSGRRVTSDLRACAAAGQIDRVPSYNTVFRAFERPELAPLLMTLVEQSAAPLAAVERQFAVDSTGFGTTVYRRWFDEKYGSERSAQVWMKAHAMVGVVTHVVTAVKVTDGDAGDCPELPGLLAATTKRFDVREVSADKAYLSHANLAAIEATGATPYVPFKSNSQGEGPPAWRRLWGLFTYRQDEFFTHYHKRSNVESVFSAMKRRFGGALRSRCRAAQVNEILAKCVAHNIAMVVHAMHALGVEPVFGESRTAGVGT